MGDIDPRLACLRVHQADEGGGRRRGEHGIEHERRRLPRAHDRERVLLPKALDHVVEQLCDDRGANGVGRSTKRTRRHGAGTG